MINHARCLLLNQNPLDRPALGTFGEEYVPSDYRVLTYDSSLTALRSTMLGVAGDSLFQNYRLAQLMACLHGVPQTLRRVLELDGRFTYRPFELGLGQFDQAVTVEPVNEFVMQCAIAGTPAADERAGRSTFRYQLTTLAGPALQIKDYGTGQTRTADLTITGELSEPVPLTPEISAVLSVPTGSWRTDATWVVTALAVSRQDLSSVLANVSVLPAAVEDLGRTGNPTFVQLWKYGVSTLEQLAGMLGLFLDRAEGIRLA
jgi:hypothetical protein